MLQSIIVKVASTCNLNCSYCYYRLSENLKTEKKLMEPELIHNIIEKFGEYSNANKLDFFTFFWHGGEPLLAGIDFYKTAISLQKKYFSSATDVINSIQTNGVLLNEQWLDFIKVNNIEIGLSIDGPSDIHDIRRKDINGSGTYKRVLKSVNLLNKFEVPLKILCVVTPEAIGKGKSIYKHFRSLNCEWMDFLYPIRNNVTNTFDTNVSPDELADFFIDVFDAWISEDNENVFIRSLHDWVMLLLNGKPSMCHSYDDCSTVITINTDGRVFICDDLLPYIDSEIGNINNMSIEEIINSDKLVRLSKKENIYSSHCLKCQYFPICVGGCAVFRIKKFNDIQGKNTFCTANKKIIDHISSSLKSLSLNSL